MRNTVEKGEKKMTWKMLFSVLMCIVMLLTACCACAQDLDARWSLGNIRVTLEDEEFLLAPQARLDILQDEHGSAADFEIGMGDDVLMPIRAQIDDEGLRFSLGDRVYRLEFETIGEILELGEEDKKIFSQLGTMIESAYGMGNDFLRKYEDTVNRMYEIMVAAPAEQTEIAVGDKLLPAHLYAGEFKLVHLVDLLEYMRECEIPEVAALTQALLEMMNSVNGKNYITFTEPYYDGMFGNYSADESFGNMEIIIAYDDAIIYEKATIRDEEGNETITETISNDERTTATMTSLQKDDDYTYSDGMRLEIDTPEGKLKSLRMAMDYTSRNVDKKSAADRVVTADEKGSMTFEAVKEAGLWGGRMYIAVDTDTGYDYGEGPVVINESVVIDASYAETMLENGSIRGNMNALAAVDGENLLGLSFDLERGNGAQVATLSGEGIKEFVLGADTADMAYKLLRADLLSFAAQAAELYADEGIYHMMNYFNEESYEWPEELGEELEDAYNRHFYSQWWEVYSFADARRIFKGSMPEYDAPEGCVLENIQAGANNMILHYASNADDFSIDITHLGDTSMAAQSEAVEITPADFTYVEEDGLVTMAYFYNGDDILVFFYFEEADQARAEEIIAGLELKTKKVVLVA